MPPKIHDSFVHWVESDVLPLKSKTLLDDRVDGRTIFGRFKHAGRVWKVHSDTRIERVRRAYDAIKNGHLEVLVVEPAGTRDCLNLRNSLRKSGEYKHFYVYESGK